MNSKIVMLSVVLLGSAAFAYAEESKSKSNKAADLAQSIMEGLSDNTGRVGDESSQKTPQVHSFAPVNEAGAHKVSVCIGGPCTGDNGGSGSGSGGGPRPSGPCTGDKGGSGSGSSGGPTGDNGGSGSGQTGSECTPRLVKPHLNDAHIQKKVDCSPEAALFGRCGGGSTGTGEGKKGGTRPGYPEHAKSQSI